MAGVIVHQILPAQRNHGQILECQHFKISYFKVPGSRIACWYGFGTVQQRECACFSDGILGQHCVGTALIVLQGLEAIHKHALSRTELYTVLHARTQQGIWNNSTCGSGTGETVQHFPVEVGIQKRVCATLGYEFILLMYIRLTALRLTIILNVQNSI